MDPLRLALVQMRPGEAPDANLEEAITQIGLAAERGAQVVCLPELFLTPYPCQEEDPARFGWYFNREPISAISASTGGR